MEDGIGRTVLQGLAYIDGQIPQLRLGHGLSLAQDRLQLHILRHEQQVYIPPYGGFARIAAQLYRKHHGIQALDDVGMLSQPPHDLQLSVAEAPQFRITLILGDLHSRLQKLRSFALP